MKTKTDRTIKTIDLDKLHTVTGGWAASWAPSTWASNTSSSWASNNWQSWK